MDLKDQAGKVLPSFQPHPVFSGNVGPRILSAFAEAEYAADGPIGWNAPASLHTDRDCLLVLFFFVID
jgi:hypothetical protein